MDTPAKQGRFHKQMSHLMKIVTFNIRCDFGQDDENRFDCRKPLILDAFRREPADILCFQELLPHTAKWVDEVLPDHIVLGCGREKDLSGERVAVAFRKSRFELVKLDTFWLSPTPLVPGSRYEEQSRCPRTCVDLILHDLKEKRLLRILNTHLDHEGVEARLAGLRQVLSYEAESVTFPNVPSILTGDFNAQPDSPELAPLRNNPEWHTPIPQDWETFHNYGRVKNNTIDYIYLKGALRSTTSGRWTDCKDGVYLSDHYPVWTELQYT